MSGETQRLARAIHDLNKRKEQCSELGDLVTSLRRGGIMVVDGEAAMVEQLVALVGEGEIALRRLALPDPAIAEELAALEESITDSRWEIADSLAMDLAAKQQRGAELRAICENQLSTQQQLLVSLRQAIERARTRLAATRDHERHLREIGDIEQQARRALDEAQHVQFAQKIAELKDCDMEAMVRDLRRRTDGAPEHWRHVEVLLIRSQDRARKHDHYSVILRTPSEPGTHGLNIQDSSTLTSDDRRSLLDRAAALEDHLRERQAREQTRAVRGVDDAGPDDVPLGNLEPSSQALGDEMFRVILPRAMQDYIHDTNCSMTITTNDLELPWELMNHKRQDQVCFMCLDRPVARMPMGTVFPKKSRARAPATLREKLRFLLLGSNARGDLPGVVQEIEKIAKALCEDSRGGVDVEAPPATARVLSDALLSGKYDVIHYAGHALFDRNNPHLSSLQLDDGKPFLAERIVKLLEGNPVVFLNACGTGATARKRAREPRVAAPAEGLASAFIEGGALGCIGNLWPVHDGAAADFAIDFYQHLIDGHTIGKSMLTARHTVRRLHPNRVTWASFVLFGNPLFRLDWSR